MPRVVSVGEETYRELAEVTGKLMQTTKEPTSLSSVVSLSVVIMDTLLQRVQEEARKDSNYREKLTKALRKKDREGLKEIFIDSLKD